MAQVPKRTKKVIEQISIMDFREAGISVLMEKYSLKEASQNIVI